MSDLISVIIPIYKVEKYIVRCVESIVNQTYTNLEIILVDDGSPDNCPQICDDYAEKDNRIKVVHKENGGLSDARNAGMKVATGDYISFIDSDDYVSIDFIETLYSAMLRENSDIVECEIVRFYENEIPNIKDNLNIESFDTEKGLSLLIDDNKFHQHVWNKLYKSKFALKVPFEKGKLNEDEFWTYQVFGRAEKVTKIYKTIYFYLQRESSIMGNSFNLRRLDALDAKEQRQVYIKKNFPNLVSKAKIDFFSSCIFLCQTAMKYLKGNEKKQAKKIIKKYVKKCKLNKEDIKIITGRNLFWFSFANIFFTLCCKIRSVTGIGF